MPRFPRPRPNSSRPGNPSNPKGSWDNVAGWYDRHMGKEGASLQKDVVFPGTLRLLEPHQDGAYIDLACGQGAFAELLAKKFHPRIQGLDASPRLIEEAQRRRIPNARFRVGDARKFAHEFPAHSFDGATCILALQNLDPIQSVFHEMARVLKKDAPLVLVLNHPCFRQPRQSGWGWDDERKLQYRRVDRYLSEYEMPILAHPGSDPTVKTYSYHRPLQAYFYALSEAGCIVDSMEEWTSPKTSDSGPRAKAENIARAEIPLFLALRARNMG
jgi:ubiquinone/menaquinone biosynthesis C-methylase UbiE